MSESRSAVTLLQAQVATLQIQIAQASGSAAAASAAAAAAQATANTALVNAATAQTTANTAVTNAATALTAANAAKAAIAITSTGFAESGAVSIPTTPSTVNLLAAPISLTVPAGGGKLLISTYAWVIKDGTPGSIEFAIQVDGSTVDGDVFAMAASSTGTISRVFKTGSLGAGAHTVNVLMNASAGLATINSGDGAIAAEVAVL